MQGKALHLFHAAQQRLQTFLPDMLLFFQLVVFALQLFTATLRMLNFLRYPLPSPVNAFIIGAHHMSPIVWSVAASVQQHTALFAKCNAFQLMPNAFQQNTR